MALLRICQESLTNIIRHARAKVVTVELIYYPDTVCLKVHDDGLGFNVKATKKDASRQKRFGLIGMEERAGLLGGTLSIESQKSKGTVVEVRIPTG